MLMQRPTFGLRMALFEQVANEKVGDQGDKMEEYWSDGFRGAEKDASLSAGYDRPKVLPFTAQPLSTVRDLLHGPIIARMDIEPAPTSVPSPTPPTGQIPTLTDQDYDPSSSSRPP